MRTKTKLAKLAEEFKALKEKIFPNGAMFVMHNDSREQQRYDQLFAFFYPLYRWPTWKNPLDDK